MPKPFEIEFVTEKDMQQWVRGNAQAFNTGVVCYLEGDLGAGKTSFARALLQALGYQGRVKSPTYTLLEVYDLQGFTACHFDLYRMSDGEELAYIGAEDYDDGNSLWLVEWAERAAGYLPRPDLILTISQQLEHRRYSFVPYSEIGKSIVESLHQ